MKVQVANPNVSQEEKTYLTTDYSSGTSLTVANNEGFTATWYVVVGEPGQEQTESQQISSLTSNNTIVIGSTLKFSHAKSTPIYLCQWSDIAFERKISGGSYSAISGSPFDIEWDDEENTTTIYISDGATTDTFKWRYFNGGVTYSVYSDELLGTGLERESVGFLIQQVKRNPLAKEVDDETMIDFFNDFQELVFDEIPKAWWFTKEGTTLATAVSTYKYAISTTWSDFLAQKFCLYNYISGDTDMTYPLTWSPPSEFYNLKSDANQSDDDSVKYWTLLPPDGSSAKGYIGLHPTPKTDDCYIKLVYFSELTSLDSFGDTLVIPKSKGYVDYALYRICDDIKLDSSNAEKYGARVKSDILYLKRRAKRQLGQPDFFRWRGTRGWSRLFGEGGITSSSEATENYW